MAEAKGDVTFAMACRISYAFLLRVPSETLALTVWNGGGADGLLDRHEHSRVGIVDEALVVKLNRRKHKPHGSTLRRRCWCARSPSLCPVCVIGKWLAGLPNGAQPFRSFGPKSFLKMLR